MSWHATAWAARQECGGPAGKVLLYALANYADEKGRCWPSQARLVVETELSERSIRRWLDVLKERGLVSVEEQRRPNGSRKADLITLHLEGQPANLAASATGHCDRSNRPTCPDQPATVSAPYKEEPSLEPISEPSDARERALEADFDELVKAYPKRHRAHPRDRSLKAYRAARKRGAKHDHMLAAARVFTAAMRKEGRFGTEFVPMLSTWLNDGTWKDCYAEHVEATKPVGRITSDKVFVEVATDEWRAWSAFLRATTGRTPTAVDIRGEDGRTRRGWLFDSNLPPYLLPGALNPASRAVSG